MKRFATIAKCVHGCHRFALVKSSTCSIFPRLRAPCEAEDLESELGASGQGLLWEEVSLALRNDISPTEFLSFLAVRAVSIGNRLRSSRLVDSDSRSGDARIPFARLQRLDESRGLKRCNGLDCAWESLDIGCGG
jgi:hypothetical protein